MTTADFKAKALRATARISREPDPDAGMWT